MSDNNDATIDNTIYNTNTNATGGSWSFAVHTTDVATGKTIYDVPTVATIEAVTSDPAIDKNERFVNMMQAIQHKQQFLCQRRNQVSANSNQNVFLNVVRSEYDRYDSYISQQRRDQIRSLELLDEYIDDMIKTNQLSLRNLEDAEIERKKLLGEINDIRSTLDGIIHKVNTI